MNKRVDRGGALLGALSMLFAFVLLAVWIPADVETGVAETSRGAAHIGDSLMPAAAGCLIAIAGLMMLVESPRAAPQTKTNDWRAPLVFVCALFFAFAFSMLLFRWAGPAAVGAAQWFNPDLPEYRLLRDDAPWKYLGFWSGGFVLVLSCAFLAKRKLSRGALLIAVAAPLAVSLFFDLPFDDLLLPPNGDV